MPSDGRLSRMLHVLIHMDRHEGSATSETIASMLNTSPVVVRRTMAGLREHGLVLSEKGHGGGFVLLRKLREITLLDVYRALGKPAVFALGTSADKPKCLVEQAVNAALEDALTEAEELLLARFSAVSLADIARDFERRFSARRSSGHKDCSQ